MSRVISIAFLEQNPKVSGRRIERRPTMLHDDARVVETRHVALRYQGLVHRIDPLKGARRAHETLPRLEQTRAPKRVVIVLVRKLVQHRSTRRPTRQIKKVLAARELVVRVEPHHPRMPRQRESMIPGQRKVFDQAIRVVASRERLQRVHVLKRGLPALRLHDHDLLDPRPNRRDGLDDLRIVTNDEAARDRSAFHAPQYGELEYIVKPQRRRRSGLERPLPTASV